MEDYGAICEGNEAPCTGLSRSQKILRRPRPLFAPKPTTSPTRLAVGSTSITRTCLQREQNASFQLPEAAISSPPVARAADWLDLQLFSNDKPSNIFHEPNSWTPFTDAQPWWGAIYTYQPCKTNFRVNSMKTPEQSPLFLFLLSTIPFVNTLTISFLIIWFTPTIGLTCRHFPLFGIFAAWLFSAAFTVATSFFCTGKYHWRLTILKDALIALPTLITIFLSSSGLFNSPPHSPSSYSRYIE